MAGAVSIKVEVKDAARLQKALRILAEPDAPYLREALEEGGRDLVGAVKSRAPGSMGSKTQFAGVKGNVGGLKATGYVRHPGAKSMEFGRKNYYRDYTGRNQRSGRKFRASPGQKARPFVGIVKGDQAIGAVEADVRKRITTAIDREWNRIGGI